MYFPPGQDSSFLGSFTDQNAEVGCRPILYFCQGKEKMPRISYDSGIELDSY